MKMIDRIECDHANNFLPKGDGTVDRPQRRLFCNRVPDKQRGIIWRPSRVNPRQPSQKVCTIAVGQREELFRILFLERAKQEIGEFGRIRP
jgi:hypothetical protein